MAKLVKAGVKLRDQLNQRFPGRDKSSDGWVGDSAHQARKSDHNPDKNGWVHAIDIDENMGKGAGRRGATAREFADQLIKLAREGKDRGRLKYVVYENRIASGSYKDKFWVWREGNWGHQHHIHVSFTEKAQNDNAEFDLPIFSTEDPAPVVVKPSPSTTPPPAANNKVPVFPNNLEFGNKNESIRLLQKQLIAKGFDIPAGATSYYGDQTRKAAKEFYRSIGLTSNGSKFGAKAWKRLFD
jgi:hypothetical protein